MELDEWKTKLTGYVRGRLDRVADANAVDEVVQETLIRLWELGDRFENHPCQEGLVFKIASGKVADYLTRRKRTNELGQTNCDLIGGDTLLWDSERDDSFDRLEPLIEQLSPPMRKVIRKRLLGLPLKQIAEEMGRTEHSVEHLSTRAMKRLKELAAGSGILTLFLLLT